MSNASSITQVVFQSNLQQILAEAIRRRAAPLKDAVEKAIKGHYQPADLIQAWLVGCDTLRQTKLCLLCIADIGKLASLKLFPMATLLPSIQAIRRLFDPIDDELQLRMVQTAISIVSVCDAGQPNLEEPLGFILMLFSSTKSPIVQAACSAAITQTSHTILSYLQKDAQSSHSSSSSSVNKTVLGEDAQSSLIAAQLQAVAYFKDVCAMASGLSPKWLKLEGHLITMNLRLLLVDTLTNYLQESSVVVSGSPLFIQCLNEDLTALVLGCDEVTHTDLFSKLCKLAMTALQQAYAVMRHTAPAIINYHTVVVQNCVQIPWKMAILLSIWRKALTNFSFLSSLLQYAEPGPIGSGVGTSRSRTTSPQPQAVLGLYSGDDETDRGAAVAAPIIGLILAAAGALEAVLISGTTSSDGAITVPSVVSPERVSLAQNHSLVNASSADLASSTGGATVVLNTSFSTIGQSDAAAAGAQQAQPQQQLLLAALVGQVHPASDFVGTMLDFITITTQSLSRMLDTQRQQVIGASSSSLKSGGFANVLSEDHLGGSQRQLVCTLGPKLLQCCRLAMVHLVGEDIIHSIIKATTHMILCCCLTGQQQLRDEFLAVLGGGVLSRKQRSGSSSSIESDNVDSSRSVSPAETPSNANNTTQQVGGGASTSAAALTTTRPSASSSSSLPHQSSGIRRVQSVNSFVGSLEGYQRKIHILSALVSIASGMGPFLHGGWSLVTRCFLSVDELLDDLTKASQHDLTAFNVLQDALPLKEAIRDVFASSSTFSDETLQQLLSSFVTNALSLPLSPVNKSSLQFASECIAVCLKSSGGGRGAVVWSLSSKFYQYVMSSPQHLGNTSMVDDVAQVFAHCITDGTGLSPTSIAAATTNQQSGSGGSANNRSNSVRSTSTSTSAASTHRDPQSTGSPSVALVVPAAVKAFPITLMHDMYSSTVSDVIATYIVRDMLRLVQQYGQLVPPGVWVSILNLFSSCVNRSAEDAAVGFRGLEAVHHGYVTQLDDDGIGVMISCAGMYIVQRAAPERINVNLSAVQMLWSIADHLGSMSAPVTSSSTQHHVHAHVHWSRLMLELCEGSLDTRQEVRHSALKSLSSLIVTHGAHLPHESWRTYVYDVLLRIVDILQDTMDDIVSNAGSSARNGNSKRILGGSNTFDSEPSSPAEADRQLVSTLSSPDTSSVVLAAGALGGQQPLAQHLRSNPALLDEMRNVVVESGSRALRLYNQVLRLHVPRYSAALTKFIGFVSCMSTVRLIGGSIEDVTLAGVKALHAMLIDLVPQGMSADDIELSWSAVEGIVLEASPKPTGQVVTAEEAKQATPNVLTCAVEALGDVCAKAFHCRASSPMVPFGNFSLHAYFQRLIGAVEAALQSDAVVSSYFFPGKVQCAVLAMLERLFPLIAEGEWQSILGVCFNQFPSRMAIEHYINAINAASAGSGGTAASPSLRDVLPRGAHPNFVLKIVGLLQSMASTAPYAVLNWMLPVTIRAVGTLLLLELGPSSNPSAGGGKSIVGSFTVTTAFFEQVSATLKFFLWDVLIAGRIPEASSSTSQAEQVKRREALCAVCSVFASCVHQASQETPAAGGTDSSLTISEPAVKRLEQLVLWIGELIEYCAKHNDLQSAADLLSALVPASALAGPILQPVARRSWSILNRWSTGNEGSTTTSPAAASAAIHHQRTPSLVQREANLRTTLRTIARTNLSQRNSIVVEHYLHDYHQQQQGSGGTGGKVGEATTAALMDALTSLVPSATSSSSASGDQHETHDLESLKASLPHLARLITVDDVRVRAAVQRAMEAIFALIL